MSSPFFGWTDNYSFSTRLHEYIRVGSCAQAQGVLADRRHRVIGQALVLQRSVRKQNQLSPQDLLSYLRRTSDLSQKLSDMTNDLPPELRIEETRDGGETL